MRQPWAGALHIFRGASQPRHGIGNFKTEGARTTAIVVRAHVLDHAGRTIVEIEIAKDPIG